MSSQTSKREVVSADHAIFALKASTLLKLTGFDPKKIDLEMFRKMALLVFMRAYKIIYDEDEVPGVSNGQMDYAMSFTIENAQSFLKCLQEKTESNEVLTSFSAADLVDGKHFCVGVLVGVLYNELQAFILATMNERLSEKEKRFKEGDIRLLAESVSANNVLQKDPPSVPPSVRPLTASSSSDALVTFQSAASCSERVATTATATATATTPSSSPSKGLSVRFDETVASGGGGEDGVPVRPQSAGDAPASRTLFTSPIAKTAGAGVATPNRGQSSGSKSPYLAPPFALPCQDSPTLRGAVRALQETLIDMEITVDYESAREEKRSRVRLRRTGPPPPEKDGGLSRHGRTLKSIQDYTLQRRRERKGYVSSVVPRAHFFGAYRFLEPLDVLITIEHCHACEHHNFSMRHTETDYTAYADHVFRRLAQVLHDSRVCCRVGVYRFHACVRPEIGEIRDVRIGAFEVQIAYRQTSGKIDCEVLHSKLQDHKWPAKLPLKNKIKSFISRARMHHYSDFTPDVAENKPACAEGGLAPYSVGRADWEDLPIAEEGWSFPQDKNRDDSALLYEECPENFEIGAEAASATLPSVCWLFDTRPFASANVRSRIPIGATVLVTRVPSVRGGVERHRLIGTVESYPVGPHVASNSVLVRLKHFSSPTLVQASCCQLHSEPEESDDEWVFDGAAEEQISCSSFVPCELSALLLLSLSRFGTGGSMWRRTCSDDIIDRSASNGTCLLATASFFQQLRAMVFDIEKVHSSSSSMTRVRHPVTGELVDLQNSYGPRTMRWVERRFDSALVDVLRLERLVTSDTALSSSMRFSPAKSGGSKATQSQLM